jgi:hypothetical protein
MGRKERINVMVEPGQREQLERVALASGYEVGGHPNVSAALRLVLRVGLAVLNEQQRQAEEAGDEN